MTIAGLLILLYVREWSGVEWSGRILLHCCRGEKREGEMAMAMAGSSRENVTREIGSERCDQMFVWEKHQTKGALWKSYSLVSGQWAARLNWQIFIDFDQITGANDKTQEGP